MRISIVNSQKSVKIDLKGIKETAAKALARVADKDAELSVYVVDDAEIRYLNYRYRNVDKPTDVLAFSMREGQSLKGGERILGDVVISAETAVRQARRYKKKATDEIRLYLAHGILHLVGYDDRTARERKKMERLQDEILGSTQAIIN